jgi:hypothetical protein
LTAFLIITILLILLIEGIPLFNNKMWKELICVVVLLCAAVIIQISSNMGMITGIKLIEKVLEPIGKRYLERL